MLPHHITELQKKRSLFMAEAEPLMDDSTDNTGIFNTTRQFLRSFSIISDDSDFDELDEPETPGDFLDHGCTVDSVDGDGVRRQISGRSTGSDGGKNVEQASGILQYIILHFL